MKLAQFKTNAGTHVGVLTERGLVDLRALAQTLDSAPSWLVTLTNSLEIILRGDNALREITSLLTAVTESITTSGPLFSPDAVEFLPPVFPGKILAIGRNYADHAIEQGQRPPDKPMLFNKLANSLSAHNAPIVLHEICSKVDYEAELAVVVGQTASRVPEDQALNYVFGFTPFNDVSARDLQFGDGQWTRGKGLDGFAPLGPYITTRDEITDVHNLSIEGRLNDDVMQSSNTGKMIFKIPFLISYLSQAITLEPGDVIATGTPEGVGIFREPPVLLKRGDVFEVTIERLGTLRNPVVGPS